MQASHLWFVSVQAMRLATVTLAVRCNYPSSHRTARPRSYRDIVTVQRAAPGVEEGTH